MSSTAPERFVGTPAAHPSLSHYLSSLEGPPRKDQFATMAILEYPESGIAIYFDKDQRVCAMFFHGVANDGYKRFAGVLPLSLSFDDAKADVEKQLRAPSTQGIERSTGLPWERYDFEGYSIHLQFNEDLLSIRMITLMSPAMAAGEA